MSVDPTVDTLMAYVEATPDNPETPEDTDPETEAEPTPATPPAKILGKYANEEEAQKGLHNLIQKMTAETDARVRAENRIRELEAQVSARREPDPLDGITDDEPITKEKFVKVIEDRASKIAEAKMQPVLTAINAAMEVGQAEQAMLNEFGNQYYADLPTFREFLSANPKVQELVERAEKQGQPLLARQYGYAEFKRAEAQKVDATMAEKGKARKDANEVAKKDSTILGADRRNVGPATVGNKPRMSREEASALVSQVRRGDYSDFDKRFSIQGIPSEEELRKMTRWY